MARVDVVDGQRLQRFAHVLGELADAVPLRVERVAELLVLASPSSRRRSSSGSRASPRNRSCVRPFSISLSSSYSAMRSAMCAFAGTTGRIQTSKICALARDVRVREELEHAARERLDVGVVAVVHAAHLADALVQLRPEASRCSPSQARATESAAKSGCARVTSIGKPERDRGRARVLLEDLHLDARTARRLRRLDARRAGSLRAAAPAPTCSALRPSRRARRR